jgi:large conductance mechanosensitive channel
VFQEFKQFIVRGNVVDLAVAVVIGAAFTLVVNSLVDNIINPIIGLAGDADFSEMGITLREGTATQAPIVLGYGAVLSAIINFVLIAAAVFFIIVKPLNALAARRKSGEEAAEDSPTPSDEALILAEIRDLLRSPQAGGPLP